MAPVLSLLGDPHRREIRRSRTLVERINALEAEMAALSDDDLRARTDRFRERLGVDGPDFSYGQSFSTLLGEGEEEDEEAAEARSQDEMLESDRARKLNELLPEAFAVVREAARRTLGMRPYDVQLIGGIVLHQGKIAEMKTGEGKTLVASLPLYLNALEGRGAHLITANDYLARRDAGWNAPVYNALGMTVGVIVPEQSYIYDPDFLDQTHPDERLQHLRPCTRREAYAADITYATNNELGFDYLRDNMALSLEHCVQRRLHYGIVDEVDSILVDEARTPLIISGQANEPTEKYYTYARLIPRLVETDDYVVHEKEKTASLTEEGVAKLEKWTGIPNIFDIEHVVEAHQVNQALRAHAVYRREREYLLQGGEVVIVDEFTGRTMPGRRWSDGLHQAIEAKEGVKVRQENITLATITFQNLFRLYHKLAGMTGTAITEAEEFSKIYKLEVVPIPTNRPNIRKDEADVIFKSEDGKFNAVVEEIKERHALGQPVLVGTTSIEKSERLARLLEKQGLPHTVLNAKYHEREAEIIKDAGQKGAVTIATNMAGRGTDILLGDHVPDVGGLYIIGTERHDSRRIDNQLRGRTGRQGDPGETRFFLSFEDDLMRVFGGERMQSIMARLGLEEDQPIESRMVSRQIEGAQSRREGYLFDMRRHTVEYDDVMNKQREIIYGERRKILEGTDTRANVARMIEALVREEVPTFCSGRHREAWDLEGLWDRMREFAPLPATDTVDLDTLGDSVDEVGDTVLGELMSIYDAKEEEFGQELMRRAEHEFMLRVIDQRWQLYLTQMDHLREGINLQAYAQKDPLVEYKNEAFHEFGELTTSIQRDIVRVLLHAQIQRQEPEPEPLPATPPAVPVNGSNGSSDGHDDSDVPRQPSEIPAARPAAAAASGALARVAAPVAAARRPAITNVVMSSSAGTRPAAATAAVVGKVGRNDPCPCGSGKKYKRCHGA